jgi:glycosyltransferase involved in cell wall biosynthesis
VKRILFVFDRVTHYHAELFRRLEQELEADGVELHLASGMAMPGAVGRVGLTNRVLKHEWKYRFHEWALGGYTLRTASGIDRLVRLIRPSAIVCMAQVGNLWHWWLALNQKRLGYALISWQCGYEYHPGVLKGALLSRFIPRFKHHLAYHNNARAYVLKHGACPDQVTVIHNTINEERIALWLREEARAYLLARHPEIGDRRIALYVGAMLPEKRVELILDALAILRRPDLILVAVGDGDHMPVLRQHCAGRSDVVLTGAIIEGVGPYFDAAEMYLLPGTGGLGLNEAMAHGLPMISAYADGSADDLVVDGETGYRFRSESPAELAGLMAKLLDEPALARRMGATGRERITGKFAFREFIQRVRTALLGTVERTAREGDHPTAIRAQAAVGDM